MADKFQTYRVTPTLDGSYGASFDGISRIVGIGAMWASMMCRTTSAMDWLINIMAMSWRFRKLLWKNTNQFATVQTSCFFSKVFNIAQSQYLLKLFKPTVLVDIHIFLWTWTFVTEILFIFQYQSFPEIEDGIALFVHTAYNNTR